MELDGGRAEKVVFITLRQGVVGKPGILISGFYSPIH